MVKKVVGMKPFGKFSRGAVVVKRRKRPTGKGIYPRDNSPRVYDPS
jgi:hypothetical protein